MGSSITSGFSSIINTAGPAISGLAGIVGAKKSYDASIDQYNAQVDYQIAQTKKQIEENYNRQVAIRQEESQQLEILNRQKIVSDIAFEKKAGSLRASAAARGVGGNTVAMAIQEYTLQGAMYNEGINRQQQMLTDASESNIKAIGKTKFIAGEIEKPSRIQLYSGISDAFTNIGNLFNARDTIHKQELLKL